MYFQPNIKHDWYQTDVAVVITVLVKNVKQEDLTIKFSDTNIILELLELRHKLEFKLSHLIVPSQCSYKITPSKIEIKLKKAEGIRWEKLEGDPNIQNPKPIMSQNVGIVDNGPPKYPTSKGTDWSAIERDISKQEANEKPEGEEALNKLFQEIYGKGSDEVKRAMNKSYMESGGTVLSTNWDEISKKKVDVKPPDGVEFKKWDS